MKFERRQNMKKENEHSVKPTGLYNEKFLLRNTSQSRQGMPSSVPGTKGKDTWSIPFMQSYLTVLDARADRVHARVVFISTRGPSG